MTLREEIAKELYSQHPQFKGYGTDAFREYAWDEIGKPTKEIYYDKADAVLALIQPRFEQIGNLGNILSTLTCVKCDIEASVLCSQILTLCTLKPEPDEPDDNKELILKNAIYNIITDSDVYNTEMMNKIMQLVKESTK